MPGLKTFAPLLVMLGLLAGQGLARAADISLRLATFPNGNHLYFHELLQEALQAAGHTVRIQTENDLPQTRILAYLGNGALTLHWLLQTPERDRQYIPVDQRLTQGLIGQRILLIPPGAEGVYAKVRTLEDLRALDKTAGLGQGWYDVEVWQFNQLRVTDIAGDWRVLYGMVSHGRRGIDYFPRGATEVLAEARAHPELAIEPRLVLVYPRDLRLYLARPYAALKPVLEDALQRAEKSGLQRQLLERHFGPAIAALGLERRTRIPLVLPPDAP